MNPLQHINKISCTISAFCCIQIIYSQIPKESTFPLEIAELIGLKICDNYTLSYFVTNDSLDSRESYNHGMIVQEKEKKGIKSKNAINYYSSGIKINNSYVDKILYLDSVFID